MTSTNSDTYCLDVFKWKLPFKENDWTSTRLFKKYIILNIAHDEVVEKRDKKIRLLSRHTLDSTSSQITAKRNVTLSWRRSCYFDGKRESGIFFSATFRDWPWKEDDIGSSNKKLPLGFQRTPFPWRDTSDKWNSQRRGKSACCFLLQLRRLGNPTGTNGLDLKRVAANRATFLNPICSFCCFLSLLD